MTETKETSAMAKSGFRKNLGKLLRDPMGVIGLSIVVLIVLGVLLADFIAPYDPAAINVRAKFDAPSWTHLLGTDELGRDLFSRALFGGRVALKVALTAALSALALGTFLGLIAAYVGGWVDRLIMLALDTVRAYPVIIFALAIGPIFGAGLWTVIFILAVASVPYYARLVRTSALSLITSDFIDAERAMGSSAMRIITRHLMPNVIGPILIVVSMDIPVLIAAEAGLSFLGVGIKPPEVSWGLLLDQGYRFIQRAPWMVMAAGIPLVLTTLGFTFLGEAIRDAFDPKFKRGKA